jgi:hypothetical protein
MSASASRDGNAFDIVRCYATARPNIGISKWPKARPQAIDANHRRTGQQPCFWTTVI